MDDLALLSFFIIYCISAVTSYLNAAFQELPYSRLSALAEDGNHSAVYLASLHDEFSVAEKAALLYEMTLTSVGTFLGGIFAVRFFDSPVAFTTIMLALPFYIVSARFLPKTLAVRNPFALLSLQAMQMRLIMFLFSGIARLTISLQDKIALISKEEASIEEIDEMLETAHEEGSIDEDEYRILKNIIRFDEVLVSDVMTPRTVVFSCRADMLTGEALSLPELRNYSRFPVWEEHPDSVIGYVLTRDLLWNVVHDRKNIPLRDIAREVYFVPENISLDKALDIFLLRRQHLFVAVDEHGGVEGLITMEDVLETILGVEIIDEADSITDLRELAKLRRNRRIESMSPKNETDANDDEDNLRLTQ